MEVNGSSDATPVMSICVRAGCNNPAIESKEWDKEYCSNECVVTHCRCAMAHTRLLSSPGKMRTFLTLFLSFRDVFEAWCSIRNQTMGTVK